MFRPSGLPLIVLLAPLTLTAAPKGKGDGLTQKEIVDVIQANTDDARACYQEAVNKDKDAEGRVKIRFLIGLNGKIEASEVEKNTFKDKSIGTCLRNKMKAWTFPKPRGEQRISIAYPFEFKKAPPPPPPAPAEPTPPTPPTDGTAPATPGTAPATPPTPEAPQAPTTP